MNKVTFIAIFLAALLVGFLGYQLFFRPQVKLPKGEPREEKIMIEEGKEQNILVTDGVKHSIPLNEIISGGPPKDGIPSVDNPKFMAVSEANGWLKDAEPGLAFSRGNTHRFYPYQILVWHEIVNDSIEGERILVTYCPLCLSGFVFDPVVKGERVEFGTSGKLWKSNLVMYDRKTDSLWSQILGEAIVGEMTGIKLKLLESDLLRYGDWKKKFPQGQVMSRDTGATRFYGSSPYGDYFSPVDFAIGLTGSRDARLSPEAFIFGIVINEKAKAYLVDAVKSKGEVEDDFQGVKIILRHDKELDVVRMFKKTPDGREERINPFSAFWFSWSAVHPATDLYK
ncbi:MAG: DUF3179 domain-containing protein [Candidatus Sungiibacteriota bacterium]|uniref:DUF3179 domain-containing protein n=1 Tax=Candidatus Sungiibacteriota bacterium TaxID=2750080 RepID=A0A7T5UR55_9BACT|nr:MAG: DUF3179 domain-containing protein [Candidatus Sungbacteria bacterium]